MIMSVEPVINIRELGADAARRGRAADECPYPMGKQRREWIAGYFSVKKPLEDDTENSEDN
jgi:ribosome modulation factor